MASLRREDWYDLYRDVEWTLSYVDQDAVFPEWLSGTGKVPIDAWKQWDEPYKITYPEYVATQREKEASAYAVKSALRRSSIFENLDEGWKSVSKIHYGAVSLIEYLAVLAELRMARFGLSPAGGRWRDLVRSTRFVMLSWTCCSLTSSSAGTGNTIGRSRRITPTNG
jgi:toluene monooxygenase system protein A